MTNTVFANQFQQMLRQENFPAPKFSITFDKNGVTITHGRCTPEEKRDICASLQLLGIPYTIEEEK